MAQLPLAQACGTRSHTDNQVMVAFRGETKRSAFVLALTLWAVPLLVCGVSVLTAEKLFVPRYLIQSDVGLALLAGLGIGCLRPAVARSMVTVSIMIWALGAFGSAHHLWPIHGHEDWRSAMAAVRQRAGTRKCPLSYRAALSDRLP